MPILAGRDGATHYDETGPDAGPALVLAHPLGLDASVWERLIGILPPRLRTIRYDLRGHGRSDVPPPPYFMGDLVRDAGRLIAARDAQGSVFLGLSIGGVVALGLASERPDLIRGAIVCCAAAKLGTPDLWEGRAAQARSHGVGTLAPAVLERWFPPAFRAERPETVAQWEAKLAGASPEGYAGCCLALADTDLRDALHAIRTPVLAIAGGRDGSVPGDLVRETAAEIPGAEVCILPASGHLPPVDAPERLAEIVRGFLMRVGFPLPG